MVARRRTVIVLEILLGLCALGGALDLVTHPANALPARYLTGTGFGSWRLPGIALGLFVGGGPLLATWFQRRPGPWARRSALLVGGGLLAWLLVEALWVVWWPPLQLPLAALGLVILWLARGL